MVAIAVAVRIDCNVEGETWEMSTEGRRAQSGVIDLYRDEPQALENLLRYIYTANYLISDQETLAEYMKHLELAIVVDRYGHLSLSRIATGKLETVACKYLEDVRLHLYSLLTVLRGSRFQDSLLEAVAARETLLSIELLI